MASEKVRWSLHTARLKLAKKQQYCQFFTRFGKCNKNGGKCPYIHDPTKIAICTKFLRGLCSNTNCKLTHKVMGILFAWYDGCCVLIFFLFSQDCINELWFLIHIALLQVQPERMPDCSYFLRGDLQWTLHELCADLLKVVSNSNYGFCRLVY